MRIALVNHYAVPPTSAGGTRHWDLAEQWDAAGHEVRVVASSFNHFQQSAAEHLPPRTPIGQRSGLHGLPTRAYSGNGAGRALSMLGFAARVLRSRRLLAGSDVVVGSSPHPFAALAAMAVARRRRVPFVLEVRDLWPQTLVDMGAMDARSVLARVLYGIERRMVQGADGVVFLPPQADRYLAHRGLRARRTLHAPNSAPPVGKVASPTTGPAVEALARVDELRRQGIRVFCYAGTIGRANGLEAVVQAFLSDDLRGRAALVVCGDGPEREALAALAPPGADVLFTGQLPKADAFAVVARCDVALFHLLDAPVFEYGLSPNKLIDYLHLGKPVLYAGPDVRNPTTDSGATTDATPGDATSIAAAAAAMADLDDTELAAMGERARAHGRERFSVASVASSYADFLHEVVAAGAPVGRRASAGRSSEPEQFTTPPLTAASPETEHSA